MLKKLVCTCGKESSEIEGNESNGQKAAKTGFQCVSSFRCIFVWLCPGCYKRAVELAHELNKIVKDDSIFLASLIRS